MTSHGEAEAAGSPRADGKSTDSLRRRLAQAEMQLREMEAESKRVAAQQQVTLDVVRRENNEYLERIEQLRMDECVDNLDFSEGTMAAKILAMKNDKYCRERDLVADHRAQMCEADAELAATRQKMVDLKLIASSAKKRAISLSFAASAELVLQRQSTEGARSQLKSLESRLIREQEILGEMTLDAKTLRYDIDGTLIEQSRFDKTYALRLNELLDKQKEISYAIEVCQLIFEERDHQAWELREVQRIAQEEKHQYEEAFNEITAVLDESKRQTIANEKKNEELRASINDTRVERMGLEKDMEELSKTTKAVHPKRSARSVDDVSAISVADDCDSLASKVKAYKEMFDALGDVADVETIADIVDFPQAISEKRFGAFSEMNYLDSEIEKLETEKRSLLEEYAKVSRSTSGKEAERAEEMRKVSAELEEVKRSIETEKENLANTNRAIESITADTECIFNGLECSAEMLLERTAMQTIQPTSLIPALCIAEHRLEEYVLHMFRKSTDGASRLSPSQVMDSIAQPLLHRQDLLPRKSVTAVRQLKNVELPRTTDTVVTQNVFDLSQVDRPLSLSEMRGIAAQRIKAPNTSQGRRTKAIPSSSVLSIER